jgi:hypothetical protein
MPAWSVSPIANVVAPGSKASSVKKAGLKRRHLGGIPD